MNIQSMEYVLALAKLLNFSKAATAMCTTQPAFSRAISSFEDELGVMLFERSRRHVKVTPAGKGLIPYFEQSLELYKKGIQEAKGISDNYSGKLKIGYIPDTINQDIRLLTQRLLQKESDIELSLHETHYYTLQNQLLSEELDIVIFTSMQTQFLPGLDHYSFFEFPLCVILSETHPLSARQFITAEELRGESFVVLEHDATMSGSWSFVHRFASAHGFSPHIVKQTSMLSSALLQVSCNQGVCIASKFAGHLAPENVRIIPITGSENCVRYAVWNKEFDNPALSCFLECIKAEFASTDTLMD